MTNTLEVKYYSLTDPITGKQSKDIGWARTSTFHDSHFKLNSAGELEAIKDDLVTLTKSVKPAEDDALEITESEYNALDTSEESSTLKKRRELNEELVEVFKNGKKPNIEQKVLSAKVGELTVKERVDNIKVGQGKKDK